MILGRYARKALTLSHVMRELHDFELERRQEGNSRVEFRPEMCKTCVFRACFVTTKNLICRETSSFVVSFSP